MDRLSALLLRFGFSADTFFQGTFCGNNHFPAQPGRGHLHLVREGPATFVHADGTRLHVDAPTLILYPRPQAHGLHTGAGTAQLLCASVHLAGDGEAAIDSLPACLQVPRPQLPAMAGVLELLFDEAQHGGLGQKLVLNRLCDVLIVQLLRHALANHLMSAACLLDPSDAVLANAMTAMRDHPGRQWTVASLATLCGMSRSRFARVPRGHRLPAGRIPDGPAHVARPGAAPARPAGAGCRAGSGLCQPAGFHPCLPRLHQAVAARLAGTGGPGRFPARLTGASAKNRAPARPRC